MPNPPSPIPNGAHTGIRYAVFTWDDGDQTVGCEMAGPSLGEARKAMKQAEAADPPFDHVAMVRQSVDVGPWEMATPADLGPTEVADA